jgi:hypothetical protein
MDEEFALTGDEPGGDLAPADIDSQAHIHAMARYLRSFAEPVRPRGA